MGRLYLCYHRTLDLRHKAEIVLACLQVAKRLQHRLEKLDIPRVFTLDMLAIDRRHGNFRWSNMNYPSNIPSIAQLQPVLANNPNVVNIHLLQGVHSSKAAGNPLDPQAVVEAENTVGLLTGSKRLLPGIITDPIIETAKNHAALEFGLQPGVNIFIQQQFQQFGQRLSVIEATIANTRILSRNRRYLSDPLRPLQKYIAGDGHALVLPICGHPQLPQAAQIFQPQAPIGALPPFWNAQIDAYQHLDIFQLVIFYNDAFGIVAGDNIATRKRKLREWLTEQV